MFVLSFLPACPSKCLGLSVRARGENGQEITRISAMMSNFICLQWGNVQSIFTQGARNKETVVYRFDAVTVIVYVYVCHRFVCTFAAIDPQNCIQKKVRESVSRFKWHTYFIIFKAGITWDKSFDSPCIEPKSSARTKTESTLCTKASTNITRRYCKEPSAIQFILRKIDSNCNTMKQYETMTLHRHLLFISQVPTIQNGIKATKFPKKTGVL